MKKIALDIGNVLFHVDFEPLYAKWNELGFGVNSHCYDFLSTIQSSQDMGVFTFGEAIRLFCKDKIHYTRDLDDLTEAWNKCVRPNNRMIVFLNELTKDGVKISLLSNMGRCHYDHIIKTYPKFFKNKNLHISCKVGVRKPSKLFFQSFLIENPEYKCVLYLDDLKENVDAAVKAGLDGQVFNLEDLIKNDKLEEKLEEIKSIVS